MSKKHLSKTFKFIADSALRSLAVFLILGAAVGTYAYMTDGISWPDEGPGKTTGVVGMFVGLTPSSDYDGNQGGYSKVNSYCNSLGGAHVCSSAEMINTYNNNPSVLSGLTSGQAWINNGPPGHDLTLSNDCKGWRFNLAEEGIYGRYGSTWNFASNSGGIFTCNQGMSFACCK